MPSRSRVVAALVAALLAACGAEPPVTAVIGKGVQQAALRDGEVRVVVELAPELLEPGEDRLRALASDGIRVRRRYRALPALAAEVTPAGLERLARLPGIRRVDLDVPSRVQLDEAIPQVGLDAVQALGYGGAGITVAVIDTGVLVSHPDLSERIVGEACFCSGACCHNGEDSDVGPGAANDLSGHGTHVAGAIAGAGDLAPAGGAANAEIVSIKVFDANEDSCCVSDLIAALDWLLTERPDVDLVNMSLGSSDLFDNVCDGITAWTQAYATAVQALNQRGTMVIASSGNDGSGIAMTAPACVDGVFSVSGVWDGDYPTLGPFGGGCVELEPRVDKVACFANSNASTDLMAPAGIITATDTRAEGFRARVGTSHAAPLAAACAAALLEYDRTLTPAAIGELLRASSTVVTDSKNGLSFPRLDCEEALWAHGDPDGDLLLAPNDNCPVDANADQSDRDADGAGDACDPCPDDGDDDVDGDMVCADADNCPVDSNQDQNDRDADGIGDLCDLCPEDALNDADGDGACGDVDNCLRVGNPSQTDADGDGIGDACDTREYPQPSGGCGATGAPAWPVVVGLALLYRRRRALRFGDSRHG